MSKTQRLIIIAVITVIALACTLPSGAPTASPAPGAGGSASPTATETAAPSATLVPGTACVPTVTTNTDANVRSGPGQVYGILGQLIQGSNANVAGKNSDGTWWYIEFAGGPNGHAWIAGTVTTAICIPDTLAIVAAPPTPVPPTATNTPVPSSTPTITPTSNIIIVWPPILLFPTATPTFGFIFPIFTVGP